MKVTISCRACGESMRVEAGRGDAQLVTFEHRKKCEYYKAIELGQEVALKWIEKNGHPMSQEVSQ